MNVCPIYGIPCSRLTKQCFDDEILNDSQFVCKKLYLDNVTIDSIFDKFKQRSLSPPPSPPALESTEESDDGNSVTQDTEIIVPKVSMNPSKSIIVPGYQRSKSHSVKLTHISLVDPCPKKAVRFADDFGLALNQIKLITSDEIPLVPVEAFKYLQIAEHENSSSEPQKTKVITYMEPQFENPMHASDFHDRLSQQKILLEQANAIDNRIYGTVKLFSCSLHKRVRIHLTTDNWLSSKDYYATYIPNSYDGTYDRFSFTLELERDRIYAGNNVQFCLCYDTLNGSEYWDNNHKQNYQFDCISRTIPDYSI